MTDANHYACDATIAKLQAEVERLEAVIARLDVSIDERIAEELRLRAALQEIAEDGMHPSDQRIADAALEENP